MIPARLRKAARLLRHPLYRKGLRMGIAAAIEHEHVLRGLRLASLIDVGANKGQFSLLARALFPHAVLHAFEPLDEESARLARLFRGDRAFTLHPVALGDNSGTATMHISGRADSSSLLAITATQEQYFKGTALVACRTVAVARGDDILRGTDMPRPLMIKLDVQGHELSVLLGMRNTLALADLVLVELSFVELYRDQPLAGAVIAFLQTHGFRLASIHNLVTARCGGAVQADALFVRLSA